MFMFYREMIMQLHCFIFPTFNFNY